jgi:hypothetical protein
MNAQDMPIGSTTTTEELIVQYLDGELQRRELETVLFERLAKSEEARRMLREHLVIRGAIRNSMEDERFELSDDLDMRTRARIEEALNALPTSTGLGDAEPIRVDPTRRRLQRWAVKPSYAALALLFAIGATWFVTRSTVTTVSDVAQNAPVQQAPAEPQPSVDAPATLQPAASTESPKVVVKERIVEKPVIKYVTVPKSSAQDIAQNSSTAVSSPTVKPEESAADLMISNRYAKLLKATSKQEVVVTSHDRL